MEKFEDICQPLFKLGIKYFDYFKLFENGRYLRLINNLEYSKQYLIHINDNGAFFTEKINISQENKSYYFFLNDIKKFKNDEDPIMHLLYSFNIWNSFYIYKKNNRFTEAFIFHMTREDSEFSQFYLNNLDILEHFCDYFNNRSKDITNCSDQRKLAYFNQQFDFHNTSPEDCEIQRIRGFLQATQIGKRNLHMTENPFFSKEEMDGIKFLALGKSINEISKDLDVSPYLIDTSLQNLKGLNKKETNIVPSSLQASLSSRQQECLFLLTRGKTAKQTARILGINHRTVQTHIDLLKSKLNCHTKEQLIEKAFDSGFAYKMPYSLENKEELILHKE
jgi:DNA-binding CsgD family transcriptional regulator